MRSVLALLAAAGPALAGVQEVWWNITHVYNASPDGLYPRRVVGINGTWPPPAVNINSTDSLIVHAHNSLDSPATLHHHGMYFNSTSWMDGAMGVSQCGIPPGDDFTYVVPINSSGQHGTYWVHAHSLGQYVDGLRAPLVIHPKSEYYTYDAEYTIALSDWYHQQHSVLLKQFINEANPGGAEPIPDSALMYFAQNGTYLGPKSGTNPSPVTAAVGFNENATLPFEPGKTYRLRVANIGAFAGFFFWIDGHEMRIIEADGVDVEEYTVDQLNLGVAQRYSILVTARDDANANWAIHANMDTSMFDTVPDTLNPSMYITYSSSAETNDLGTVDDYLALNDTLLTPIAVKQMLPATTTIELEFEFDTMDDGTNHAVVNGVTYNSPNVPAIMSELTLGENATVAEAYGPLSFVVNHLDVVDIVLKNGDTGKHPFHLHGHTMQLVNFAADYTSDDPSLNPPINESQTNPMRRDTVLIPAGSAYTFRVVADNPGVWFFHCHIEWHLEVGLAIQLVEAPLVAQQRNTMPSYMNNQCAALGLPYSGNAAGHASTTDLSGLTTGPYRGARHGDRRVVLARRGHLRGRD